MRRAIRVFLLSVIGIGVFLALLQLSGGTLAGLFKAILDLVVQVVSMIIHVGMVGVVVIRDFIVSIGS